MASTHDSYISLKDGEEHVRIKGLMAITVCAVIALLGMFAIFKHYRTDWAHRIDFIPIKVLMLLQQLHSSVLLFSFLLALREI